MQSLQCENNFSLHVDFFGKNYKFKITESNYVKNMSTIEKLGFDNWFKDKVGLSKTADLKIARVMGLTLVGK